MLTFRREQLAVFSGDAREAQKLRLLVHLRDRFPAPCADLGERDLGVFVNQAMAAANEAGQYLDKSVFPFVAALFTEKWTEPEAPPVTASSSLRLPVSLAFGRDGVWFRE